MAKNQRDGVMTRTQPTADVFEDGVRVTSQGMCVVSRNWKRQGTDPERMQPCLHLDISLVWPQSDS